MAAAHSFFSRDNRYPNRARLAAGLSILLLARPVFALNPLAGDYSKDNLLDVRIVAYNTQGNFITDPAADPEFNRILIALRPDIICFEEINTSLSSGTIASRLNSIIPIGGAGWQIHLGKSGGTRNVLASRFPLSQTRIDTIPESSTRGVTIALADLPNATHPVDVYLHGVHLKCCGNAGGSEDADRQRSADAIANWLGDARGAARPSGNNIVLPPNTPMIVLGDFNLVGGPQPENTLLTGNIIDNATFGTDVKGDWDVSDLTNLNPLDPFTGNNFTWQGSQSFPPSALDRFMVTDSAFTVANKFILNTDAMTPSALAAAGLQAGDTLPQNSSDHLPIVMDLRVVDPCATDADGDGTADCNDGCPNDPGRIVPGLCGCNVPASVQGSGDVSRDSRIDAADIPALVNELLAPTAPSEAACAADVDQNGAVDESDIEPFIGLLVTQ
ncbi:MAG TPA: endonuclease/exonuclease/phosphatase family protein [Phycisphaerae bacterium]|nr:endonuclease/exonuclease/phosphatase family protein [Phycisphaerae bacterium]